MKKVVFLLPFALFACKSSSAPVGAEPTSAPTAATATGTIAAAPAALGAPAPDFELTDLDGKSVRLSSFRGKRVVLEWFNPGCPFVKAAHTKGSLKEFPKKAITEGATWLAINSGGAGKQGFGAEANKQGKSDLRHRISDPPRPRGQSRKALWRDQYASYVRHRRKGCRRLSRGDRQFAGRRGRLA